MRRLIAGVVAFAAAATACAGAQATNAPARVEEAWAFTAFWDPRSAESLARHGGSLDAAVTTWIALDTLTGSPVTLHMDSSGGARPARMALLTSWFGDRFRPASVRLLAGDPERLAAAASSTARTLVAGGHHGLVIDFEAHLPEDLHALLRVISAVADTVAARQLGPVVVAIPAMDTAGYPARAFIEAGADLVLPMLYDQHWSGGSAGPIAAPDWVEAALDVRVREIGADRIVAGLPLYGYRWTARGAGTTVSYGEALAAVRAAGTELARDTASHTLHAMLPSGEIWVTDAGLLERLLDAVTDAGVNRVALWHIGQEDPSVWSVLEQARAANH